jgi:glycolate oxidase FAD binding subunit
MTSSSAKLTRSIALDLEALGDIDLISWDNAAPTWKEKIEQAISPTNLASPNPSPTISPSHLIYPYSPEALADVIKCAHDRHWPVLPCGSGSKLSWGGLAKNVQLVISTQPLNRIIEHAIGDLTVTVEAGVKFTDLQNTLNQVNQFLPLDPAYAESATIGGIVGTADSGSWRQRYGGIRDMLLGLSFVRADGQIAKAGGRVVKNVAGYDLMKLFTGSYGTLGIISQVTLRVYPLPETSGTILLTGEKNAIATAAQTLLKSALTPTAADLLSASVVNCLAIGEGMGLIVRFQSISASVKEQSQQVELLAQQLGVRASLYGEDEEIDLWQRLTNIIRIPASGSDITCKIGIMPNRAVSFLSQLDELIPQPGLGKINISSGLGWLHLDTLGTATGVDSIKKLRSLCQAYRGFLTLLEAPAFLKQKLDPWGYNGNALEIMRQLKQKFDPENILNPGRFVGDI